MKLAFAGTPEFSVPALDALIEAGHDVVAVYTQPDRPAGRGQKLSPSPVARRAAELGIPVKLVGLGEGVDDLVEFDPDEFVEALFG